MSKKDPKIEALERKAKKAREEIKYRKACQKYNLKPLETSREYTTRVKREAKALPKELQTDLPRIEDIERELKDSGHENKASGEVPV